MIRAILASALCLTVTPTTVAAQSAGELAIQYEALTRFYNQEEKRAVSIAQAATQRYLVHQANVHRCVGKEPLKTNVAQRKRALELVTFDFAELVSQHPSIASAVQLNDLKPAAPIGKAMAEAATICDGEKATEEFTQNWEATAREIDGAYAVLGSLLALREQIIATAFREAGQ